MCIEISRSTGVPPVSHMGILPMFCGYYTGETPVRLMGKMPMPRFGHPWSHCLNAERRASMASPLGANSCAT